MRLLLFVFNFLKNAKFGLLQSHSDPSNKKFMDKFNFFASLIMPANVKQKRDRTKVHPYHHITLNDNYDINDNKITNEPENKCTSNANDDHDNQTTVPKNIDVTTENNEPITSRPKVGKLKIPSLFEKHDKNGLTTSMKNNISKNNIGKVKSIFLQSNKQEIKMDVDEASDSGKENRDDNSYKKVKRQVEILKNNNFANTISNDKMLKVKMIVESLQQKETVKRDNLKRKSLKNRTQLSMTTYIQSFNEIKIDTKELMHSIVSFESLYQSITFASKAEHSK